MTYILNTLLQDGHKETGIGSIASTGSTTLSRRGLVLGRLLAVLLRRKTTGSWTSVIRPVTDENRTDLLVLAGHTVLAVADHIDLDLAVDQVGLKGVGILHNRHSAHQTDLAGHVLVPAVHTAVAAGQVGEDQKEEHIHPVDQVGHLQVEHTVPIGVYLSVPAIGRCIDDQRLTDLLGEEELVPVGVGRTETAAADHRNHPAVAGVAVGIHLLGVVVAVVVEERLHRMGYHHLHLVVLLLTLMRDPC